MLVLALLACSCLVDLLACSCLVDLLQIPVRAPAEYDQRPSEGDSLARGALDTLQAREGDGGTGELLQGGEATGRYALGHSHPRYVQEGSVERTVLVRGLARAGH